LVVGLEDFAMLAGVPTSMLSRVERSALFHQHWPATQSAQPLFDSTSAWLPGGTRRRDWMTANNDFRRRVLDQLRASGPLASRDIPDTSPVPWESSGWTHDRTITQMLEFLTARTPSPSPSGSRSRWPSSSMPSWSG
jgi:hypothetical protein